MKKYRVLTAMLLAVILMCGFTVPALAGVDEEIEVYTGGYEPTEETEPVIEPGVGYSEDGNLITRDLLYDENTNKQFITVQTNGGHTFYIVIDYDKPVDEYGEQYYTYFLNVVDEADLLKIIEEEDLPVACACADKCTVGAVNTDCPVCSANMSECMGAETAPEPDNGSDPAANAEPVESGGNSGMLILAVIVVLLAGGAGYYFKVYRPKHLAADIEDAEPEDDADWQGENGGDYDDGPPWDEDESEGGDDE